MSVASHVQEGYALRYERGPGAVRTAGREQGVLVVVDVLSFTTSVTVAVERGMAVYPAASGDGQAARLADEVDAVLAANRRDVTPEHPWSLSPAALATAPATARLVLPSPNGSAISAAAAGRTVVAACLRNVRAVADWLHRQHVTRDRPVTVIAAGERWPDGSPRPAREDLLGAGAVLAALADLGIGGASPEAEATRAMFAATAAVADAIRESASAAELINSGFGADVEVAVQCDTSDVVPVLTDGAFRPAAD